MLFQFFPFALASLIVSIPCSVASAVPYPTNSANSTRISFPNAAATTGCPVSCYRNHGPLNSITWTGKEITATVTAETLVYVVNKKNNSTRTETITNTELDLKDYTPLPTTKTTSVVVQFGTTSRTEILSFPTIFYSDYPSSYTFCGTLPTTTAGVATCLRYPCAQASNNPGPFKSDSPVFAYPSHPAIPDAVQNISASDLALDPRGSTWDAVWSGDGDYDTLIEPLMPDMGAWNCSPFGAWPAAASALQTALYLTATSTSTEAGDEASATAAASKEPAKVEPQAASASQIVANPFGVGKPATTAETPTTTPTPSPSQAANVNGVASTTPAANPPSPQALNSNNALLPIAGLNNQPATAVPATAATAVANIIISSTNAAGSLIVTIAPTPGIIVTTTNAQGAQIITTEPVASPQLPNKAANPASVVINGHTLTTDAQSHYVLAGQTLSANTPLILGAGPSTTAVILQTSGINPVLVIGSSTTTLTRPPPSSLAITQSQYPPDGQTQPAGGAILAGGTTVSIAPTSTQGLAPYIVGGLGSGPNGTAGVVPFEGGARGRVLCRGWRWMAAGVVWIGMGVGMGMG